MNWKSGDKAVCIKTFSWVGPNGSPAVGVIYLVTGTRPHILGEGLYLAGLPVGDGESAWRADGFRKVVTRTEEESGRQRHADESAEAKTNNLSHD